MDENNNVVAQEEALVAIWCEIGDDDVVECDDENGFVVAPEVVNPIEDDLVAVINIVITEAA